MTVVVKFEKIKTGMTLYDVKKSKHFGTKWDIWLVQVKEVDEENRKVLASWNNNPTEWMTERRITQYRIKRPV